MIDHENKCLQIKGVLRRHASGIDLRATPLEQTGRRRSGRRRSITRVRPKRCWRALPLRGWLASPARDKKAQLLLFVLCSLMRFVVLLFSRRVRPAACSARRAREIWDCSCCSTVF